jgi:hypothetical protein
MPALRFDPIKEKAALFAAITTLGKQWGKPGMAHALSDLCDALARAEQALSALEQETEGDTAFEVHVLGLGFQVTCA